MATKLPVLGWIGQDRLVSRSSRPCNISLPYQETEIDDVLRSVLRSRGLCPDSLKLTTDGTVMPGAWLDEEDHLKTLPRLHGGGETPVLSSAPHLAEGGQEIGRGAMGVVIATRQPALRREVAVKTLIAGSAEFSREACKHLIREAFVTGTLAHPNIVPVHMLGQDQGEKPMLVMQRVSGDVWHDLIADPELLREKHKVNDPLHWHIEVLRQVCHAVDYAHSKRILHRDLKPENVMVGDFGQIYVLDWGLAVSFDSDNELGIPYVGGIDGIAGTPGFMPPETVLVQRESIGVQTDVYLLGAILHCIVTEGAPRHEATNVSQALIRAIASEPVVYAAHVPPELAAICNRATAKAPADRFPNVDAFRRALDEYMRHRHSRRLSVEADERASRLERMLRTAEKVDEVDLYRLFGECRFAYRQALREWPDNKLAQSGFRRLVEMMAYDELERGDLKAATILVGELRAPSEPLTRALASLRARRSDETEHVAQLLELERDVDTRVGLRERANWLFLMGLIWGGFYVVLGTLTRMTPLRFAHEAYLVINGAFGVFLLVATVRFRATFFATQVNRAFLWSVWMAFSLASLWWSLAWWKELPFGDAMAGNLLLYGTICVMAKLIIDPVMFWAGLAYLVGAAAVVALPHHGWEILAAATTIAMWTPAWRWRGRLDRAHDSPTDPSP